MFRNFKSEKGFTLAELLIVVAIIGVLVAISIPIFTQQLEKSREATDLANVRSAYAKVRTAAISGDKNDTDVEETDNQFSISVPLKQKQSDWQTGGTLSIGGITKGTDSNWQGTPNANGVCTITCNKSDGTTVINWNGGVYLASENVSTNLVNSFAGSKLSNNSPYNSNAPDNTISSTLTGTGRIKEQLDKNNIDMSAMGIKTWRLQTGNGSSYTLYVTPVDIKDGFAANEKIPVIKMSIKSNGEAAYAVGTEKAQSQGESDKNAEYNTISGGTTGYTEYSSYNDAVNAINELLKNSTNYSSYSMNKMP